MLVVDDVRINRLLLGGMLRPLGLEVDEAGSGEACLAAVAANPPDAILMDLRMPGMDGLETTRALRARGVTTPVLVISASAFAEDIDTSLAAGCQAHITKPVEQMTLLDVLGPLLGVEWEYAQPAHPSRGGRS